MRAAAEPVLHSEPNTNRVDLTWENNVPYTRISIFRDGVQIANLPGDAGSPKYAWIASSQIRC